MLLVNVVLMNNLFSFGVVTLGLNMVHLKHFFHLKKLGKSQNNFCNMQPLLKVAFQISKLLLTQRDA